MLNKKLVNVCAFLLFVWMVWAQYHKNLRIESVEQQKANMIPAPAGEAKYTITIDPNKKLEDYSWFEWAIYKLYMKNETKPMGQADANGLISAQQPRKQMIPPGSKVLYNCKPSGLVMLPTWCADGKEVTLGAHVLPDLVEEVMIHTPVGRTFRVGLPYFAVFGKNGDSGQMLFFDITVEKVLDNNASGANTNGLESK